jgi:hypothetical protein
MKTFLADGFRNVDSVSDAKKILRCLSFMDDLLLLSSTYLI